MVPLFLELRAKGRLPVTDIRMTRFWITLEQGVRFVLKSFERMEGGETFVPKLASMRIVDLAKAIAPECDLEVVGIRPGEKVHEVMVPEDDARNALEYDDYFAICPSYQEWGSARYRERNGGRPCPDGFKYSSDTNTRWLTASELRAMIGLA